MSAPAVGPVVAPAQAVRSARALGLVGCEICGRVAARGDARCARCGASLKGVGRHSLAAVWAWLIAGMIFYIPANLYPMLITGYIGGRVESTIVSGAIDLLEQGSYFVGVVILTASVVIPLAKFYAIAHLSLMVRRPPRRRGDLHRALKLFEVVEFIGRWSMIDVFVVAVLAALVQMGFLANLNPGPAAAFFALSVATTMIAARAFDPRLIWDGADGGTGDGGEG